VQLAPCGKCWPRSGRGGLTLFLTLQSRPHFSESRGKLKEVEVSMSVTQIAIIAAVVPAACTTAPL